MPNTTLHSALMRILVCCSLVAIPATGRAGWTVENTPPDAPASQSALSLDQAIANGLEYNPAVTQAVQNVYSSRALVIQARSADSVTASLQVLNTRVNDVASFAIPVPAPPPQNFTFETISVGSLQNTQGTLTIAKPLYTGGKVPALIRQSNAGAAASDAQLRRTYQTVVNQIKQAYYGVLVAADLVKVADETAAAAREHLRVAQAHFDAGTAPRFDVLRAEAQVADSEQQVIQARNALNLARAALDNAMGIIQGQEYELTTPFAPPQGELPALQTLVEQADATRPEVVQVRSQIDAAGAAVDVARADKHPTLGVAWIYNRVLNTNAFQVTSWTLALQADLTIFNGKQTSAAVSSARSQQEAARAALDQLQQGIALQVRQAYLSVNSARERIVAATKGVEQAQEAYRIAVVRYNAGVSISVEVLDAQAALTAARTNYARAFYDYNVALAQVEFATGSWQPSEQLPAPRLPSAPEKPAS